MVSTLTVRNVGEPDFGDYVCSVDNGHGENSHTVHLLRIGRVQQMANLVLHHEWFQMSQT